MSEVEHRYLRSALEFALLIAAEGQKRRPPLDFPRELKPFLAKPRLPTAALGRVRRIIEADGDFRAAIAAGAVPELVDEVGRMWLAAEPGWTQRAQELIETAGAEERSKDLRRDLKRAEKRRVAAEQAAARIQADVLVRIQTINAQQSELDELRADVTKLGDALSETKTELIDTRNELRHARDREAAAARRAEEAERSATTPVGGGSSEEFASGSSERRAVAEIRARADEALAASRAFGAEMERLLRPGDPAIDDASEASPATTGRAVATRTRTPIALPGGVISTSRQAAEHLVRADAAILVDGYNVTKLGWPDRSLEAQRDALIGRAENLHRRHGAEIVIVFDGDSVVGSHADRHRSVRVVFSPAGVTADDVIRDEVARRPADRNVVVVTDDREIVADVRRDGANVVPSNAFIATL